MLFCSKCGTQMNDTDKFCPRCGAPAGFVGQSPQQKVEEAVQNFTNTPDSTAEFDPQDIAVNKVYAILAYLGILVLVPILGAKESKFARFHANQGLVLLIAEVAVSIAIVIVTAILSIVSYALGAIIGGLLNLIWIAFLVFIILGIVNAAQGTAKELPIIGQIHILK